MAKNGPQRRNAIYEKAKQDRPAIVSPMSPEIWRREKQKVLRKSWFVWKCEFIQAQVSLTEWQVGPSRLLGARFEVRPPSGCFFNELTSPFSLGHPPPVSWPGPFLGFQHCTAFNRGEQTMNVSEPVFWVISTVRASTRGPMITCWAITHGLTQIQRQSGLHQRCKK